MNKFLCTWLRLIKIEKLLFLFILFSMPMFFAPFITDDFFHLLMLSKNPPFPYLSDGSLWGLFSFIDNSHESRNYLMQQGVLPWWTADDFYFKFWRPLAEITHYFDYVIAQNNPLFGHIHNIIWFVLTALIYFKIYKKLTNNENLAFLAVSIFVLNGHHAATIEWIANRNALMAAFFTGISFYCYVIFREKDKAIFYALALLFFSLGLFSGESAIAIGGFLFVYAILLDERGRLRGLIALLPYALIVSLWYWKYKALGYGANGSSIHYIDPAAMPLEFLRALSERIPVYIFSAFTVVPAEIYPALQLFLTDKIIALVFWGIFASILVLGFIFSPLIRRNRLLQFSLLGGVVSSVPFCSIINQDRLTLIPSLGFNFAIAIIIYQMILMKENIWQQRILSKIVNIVAILLCVTHLIFSPLLLFGSSFYIQSSNKKIEQQLLSLDKNIVDKKNVVILKSALTTSALLKPVRMLNGLSYPDKVWFISSGKGKISIKRVNENVLEIKRDIGFVEGFEESFRELKKKPFLVNDVIQIAELHIVVKKINEHGQPLIIECEFNESLNFDTYTFLAEIKGKGLQQVKIPSIGETLVL